MSNDAPAGGGTRRVVAETDRLSRVLQRERWGEDKEAGTRVLELITRFTLLACDAGETGAGVRAFVWGHVLEAADGVAAQQVWSEHQDRTALLLTDLNMPGKVDGRALASLLQARNPKPKVIFTSGYSAEIAGRELRVSDGQGSFRNPVRHTSCWKPSATVWTVRSDSSRELLLQLREAVADNRGRLHNVSTPPADPGALRRNRGDERRPLTC